MKTEHKVIGSSDIVVFEKLLDAASLDGFKVHGGISVTEVIGNVDDVYTYCYCLMVREYE